MYASITYSTSAADNVDDVLADVVKLMTGVTDKTQLSSHVVQAGSEIISTVPAGWSVEQTLSTSDVVLKAPISDDNTKFKYIRLFANAVTSHPNVAWEAYTDWDVATSSGTVVVRNFDTGINNLPTNTSINYKNYVWQNSSSTQTDQTHFLINVSANHVMFQSRYGTSYVNQAGPSILCEHTRNDAWDTVANGFPPFVVSKQGFIDDMFFSTSYTMSRMWIKPSRPDGAGGTLTGQWLGMLTPYGSTSNGSAFSSTVRYQNMIDENLNIVPSLIPFGCVNYLEYTQGGDISAKTNMYLANLSDPGNTGDVFVQGGENYRIQRLSSNRYGGGSATSTLVLLCKEA